MSNLEAFRLAPPKSQEVDYKKIVDEAVTFHHDDDPVIKEMGSTLLHKFFDFATKHFLEQGIKEVENNIIIALYREDTGDNGITILITDMPKSDKGENEFAYLAYNQDPAIGF